MPRLAAWIAAGLTALALVPSGEALTPSVRLFGILDSEVPIFTLGVEADPKPGLIGPLPPSSEPYCNAASYDPDEKNRSFTFHEDETEAGCLSVVYDLHVPAGTQHVLVSFLANRSVRQEATLAGEASIQMVQVLQVRTNSGTGHQIEVFEEYARSWLEPKHVELGFSPVGEELQLVWRFEDRGPQRPSTTGAFSATVKEPMVHLDGIPLDSPPVTAEQGRLDGQNYVARFTTEMRIPSEFLAAAAAGQFALRLEMDDILETLVVQAPDGLPLPRQSYETATAGGITTLTIPAQTVQLYAAFVDRAFVVQLERAEPLQPHATFTFLSYVALGAPAIAIGAAWLALRRTELDSGLEE